MSKLTKEEEEKISDLIEKMKDEDGEVRREAVWRLGRICAEKIDVTDEKVHRILIPAIRYLTKMVETAKLSSGAHKIEPDVAVALTTLQYTGDLSTIPALEKLRDRLRKAGIDREYVVTDIAAGSVSTEDEIMMINDAIKQIKARESKKRS